MLASWNTQEVIIGANARNIFFGVQTASMRPIVQAMKIDAVGIGHMKINASVLVASILGDFPRFCSRTVRAGSMKDTIQIQDPVIRFNAALAEADKVSCFALDTSDPWELVSWLVQRDKLDLAGELWQAAREANCWEETSVSSR